MTNLVDHFIPSPFVPSMNSGRARGVEGLDRVFNHLPLLIKLSIFAVVVAHVDFRINGDAAGPALHHEIHRDETLQQRYRQLNAGKGTLMVAADADLIFGDDVDEKYQRALRKIGIDLAMLSNEAGHA